MTPTEQDKELRPFTSLFQNAAVARDHISGCVSEEDINELAAHIFFIEQTYKYDISKAPVDNVFSAYGIAVGKLLRTEKLKLLAEVRERVIGEVPSKMKTDNWKYDRRVAELKLWQHQAIDNKIKALEEV